MTGNLFQDVKYALRNLRKTPGFAAVVCGVLALGIGATTSLFTVVNGVLLRPLPFAQSERLAEIHESPGGRDTISVAYLDYLDWRKESRSFESLAFAAVMPRLLQTADGSRDVPFAYVTGNFFDTYRVKAALGRALNEADDTPNAAPVAVLDNGFWREHFGGDPSVIGRTLRTDEEIYTIAGVLPEFSYYRRAKVYVSTSHAPDMLGFKQRHNHNRSSVTGRLKDGVTFEQAREDLKRIAGNLEKAYPKSNAGISVYLVSQHEWVAGWARKTVLMLFAAVGFLLLLACVNVANMMLARSTARAKEISIRSALGASQTRIGQQLITESLLLSSTGALLGLVLARFMVPALARLAPDSLSAGLTQPDWRVFAFSALAGILAGVLFGIAPAVQAIRVDVNHVLKEGGRSAVQAGHPRLRNALVVAQVSIALVLLAGAGLLTRSLYNLMNESPGFRTSGILAVKVSLPGGPANLGKLATRFGELRERVAAVPGAQSVASSSFTPFSPGNSSANIIPEGYVIPADGSVPAAEYRTVAPEYFATMGIPILKGRSFTKADGVMPGVSIQQVYEWFATAEYQVVINQAMARRFWPGQDPIGRRFRYGPPSMKGAMMTVAGLCGDTRLQALDRPPEPVFYVSNWMYPWPEQTLLIQTSGDPHSLTSAVRKTILAQEPGAVIAEPATLEGVISGTTAERRANIRLMGAFAGLALILAALGIYGVIAYSVGQRRQEFGVRMALGATPALLVRSVLGLGARLALIGVVIGIAASAWLARLISTMLYGVPPTDPLTLAVVAALLLVAGLAASALPAARATRVDPSEALRAE